MTALADCPFCKGPATVRHDLGNEVWPQSWRCGCDNCGVGFKEYGSSSWRTEARTDKAAEAKAVELWNRCAK